MHRLSQFPTPYPDECYYSILCRYFQRMGYLSFDRTMKSLFGKTHHTDMFILLPYLASFVNDWTDGHPQLNADVITKEHTAFYYCSLAEWTWYTRTHQKNRLWDGNVKCRTGFLNVKKEQLYYCPECVSEELKSFGEAYWHRLHQIRNVTVCEKHRIKLKPSGIAFNETKRRFIPASVIGNLCGDTFASSVPDLQNEIQFADDIKWILGNGPAIPSSRILYQYLSKKKLVENEYTISPRIDIKDFKRFYTSRNGGKLFEQPYIREHLHMSAVSIWVFNYFLPLDMVLMMEYLEGSVESFCNGL